MVIGEGDEGESYGFRLVPSSMICQ
jgi:hypothetical protein